MQLHSNQKQFVDISIFCGRCGKPLEFERPSDEVLGVISVVENPGMCFRENTIIAINSGFHPCQYCEKKTQDAFNSLEDTIRAASDKANDRKKALVETPAKGKAMLDDSHATSDKD